MSTNIYILKLQGGRYYVGKTDNPMKRYQDHLNGLGSAWTRKYKPIGVEKIIEKASPFEEDRYVKEYMNKYGIEKVRGGAYVTEELPDFQEEALKSELWGATDKCTTCGRKGHWAKDCFASKDVMGTKIVGECWQSEYSNKMSENYNSACRHESVCSQNDHKNKSKQVVSCFRCGRQGHYANDCYAKTDKYGNEFDEDEEDDYDDEDDEYHEDEEDDDDDEDDENDFD